MRPQRPPMRADTVLIAVCVAIGTALVILLIAGYVMAIPAAAGQPLAASRDKPCTKVVTVRKVVKVEQLKKPLAVRCCASTQQKCEQLVKKKVCKKCVVRPDSDYCEVVL